MTLELPSRNQTVQGVFPADDADETDGARTFKRGVRKDRGADGGLASFISAGSAISAWKTSYGSGAPPAEFASIRVIRGKSCCIDPV